jgi:hypothetical protein
MDAQMGPAARGVATTTEDGERGAAGRRAPAKDDLRRLDAAVAIVVLELLLLGSWLGSEDSGWQQAEM